MKGLSEKTQATLFELLKCARAWEPDARLLGNVRADDMAEAIYEVVKPDPIPTINLLESRIRWRRVSEEVPKDKGLYLTAINLTREVAESYWNGKQWFIMAAGELVSVRPQPAYWAEHWTRLSLAAVAIESPHTGL